MLVELAWHRRRQKLAISPGQRSRGVGGTERRTRLRVHTHNEDGWHAKNAQWRPRAQRRSKVREEAGVVGVQWGCRVHLRQNGHRVRRQAAPLGHGTAIVGVPATIHVPKGHEVQRHAGSGCAGDEVAKGACALCGARGPKGEVSCAHAHVCHGTRTGMCTSSPGCAGTWPPAAIDKRTSTADAALDEMAPRESEDGAPGSSIASGFKNVPVSTTADEDGLLRATGCTAMPVVTMLVASFVRTCAGTVPAGGHTCDDSSGHVRHHTHEGLEQRMPTARWRGAHSIFELDPRTLVQSAHRVRKRLEDARVLEVDRRVAVVARHPRPVDGDKTASVRVRKRDGVGDTDTGRVQDVVLPTSRRGSAMRTRSGGAGASHRPSLQCATARSARSVQGARTWVVATRASASGDARCNARQSQRNRIQTGRASTGHHLNLDPTSFAAGAGRV